jgi:hypothetical protein
MPLDGSKQTRRCVVKTYALSLLIALSLALLAGSARADDVQVIGLATPTDSAAGSANSAVLNGDDAHPYFGFTGGVGSGPDLSGNGSMIQVVQPITPANGNGATSNGQITYRYVPATGGH